MNKLEIKELTQTFGGINAITDVNLTINEGEIVGLIGPNGAGKTTLFNCLTGIYKPTSGSIIYTVDNEQVLLNELPADLITKKGLARTFQNIRLFQESTILNNIKIALGPKNKYRMIDAIFKTKKYRETEKFIENKAIELLSLINLQDKLNHRAKSLSYGDQRRLEIIRALATGAKIIFLDEPAAGMNDAETLELLNFIRKIHKDFNLTVVLIEHDMDLVMNVCEKIFVLNLGKLISSGTPEEIKVDPEVIKAYLGSEDE